MNADHLDKGVFPNPKTGEMIAFSMNPEIVTFLWSSCNEPIPSKYHNGLKLFTVTVPALKEPSSNWKLVTTSAVIVIAGVGTLAVFRSFESIRHNNETISKAIINCIQRVKIGWKTFKNALKTSIHMKSGIRDLMMKELNRKSDSNESVIIERLEEDAPKRHSQPKEETKYASGDEEDPYDVHPTYFGPSEPEV